MPFLPQDKECYVSNSSHAEKVFFFFKESTYISGASIDYCSAYQHSLLVFSQP
jgi:hypothetical protein